MASRTNVVLLLQMALLIAIALTWSIDGVSGEETEAEAMGEELVTPVGHGRSSFVRRQLTGRGYAGGWSRGRSCTLNKAVCTKSPYPAGWSCCGHWCTNILTDPNNCGACGYECKWPQTCCGGKCVNLSSNANNCGRCGVKCPKNGCKHGVCHYS
ncbi:unnamed protein product [Calypogeia fissa]